MVFPFPSLGDCFRKSRWCCDVAVTFHLPLLAIDTTSCGVVYLFCNYRIMIIMYSCMWKVSCLFIWICSSLYNKMISVLAKLIWPVAAPCLALFAPCPPSFAPGCPLSWLQAPCLPHFLPPGSQSCPIVCRCRRIGAEQNWPLLRQLALIVLPASWLLSATSYDAFVSLFEELDCGGRDCKLTRARLIQSCVLLCRIVYFDHRRQALYKCN